MILSLLPFSVFSPSAKRKSCCKILSFVLVVLLTASTLHAQQTVGTEPTANSTSYATGIGVRLGNTPGITVKKFMNPTGAVEGIVHVFRYREYDGFVVTGLYEWHFQAFQHPMLYWYLGVGVHAGAYDLRDDRTIMEGEDSDNGVLYGADGIVGLEYRFLKLPLSIGADLKPAITIPTNRLSVLNGAVNVRWVF